MEFNVVEQCLNVYKTGVVQRNRLKNQRDDKGNVPRIHGLIFETSKGLLRSINVDYAVVGNLDHIYNLY